MKVKNELVSELCTGTYHQSHTYLHIDMDYWLTTGREELYRSVEKTATQNEGVAKNVILFVGSGMGVATVTASRIYKAQG